jgi:hypothetical protein
MAWLHDAQRWRDEPGSVTDDALRGQLRAMARIAGTLARDGRISVDALVYELRLNALVCGFDDLNRLLDGIIR